MDRNIEFIVKGIVEGVSGRLRVIGRCSEEAIRVGDVFDSLYHVEETDSAGGEQRVDGKKVELHVRGIHAYGHELHELSPGMTGALDLEGVDRKFVEPGWLLGVVPAAVRLDGPIVSNPSHSSNLA